MRLIIFVLFILKSFAFAELYSSKVKYFCEDEERFEFLKDSKVLKDESNKMYNNLINEIIKYKYWGLEKYTVKVDAGYHIDQDKVTNYLLSKRNPTAQDEYEAKLLFGGRTSRAVKRTRVRMIEIREIVYSKTPIWSEIVSFYGGYAEINKLGLKKTDLDKFTVEAFLDRIEIPSENKCQAVVKLRGQKNYAFRFYKIDNTEIRYDGEITIPIFNKSNIDNILAQTITMSIPGNQYMESKSFDFMVKKLYPFDIQINNYVSDMNSMFDDLLNGQEFNRAKSNEFEHYASLFRKNFTLSNQQSNDLVTYSSLGSIDNIKLRKNTLELLKGPKNQIDNSITKIELIKSANSKLENRYKLGYSVFFKDIDEVNSMANSNINLMKKNNKKEKELLEYAEKKIIQDNITTGVALIGVILFLRNNPDILKYIFADLASA